MYDDIFCGSDYVDAVENKTIKDHDRVVMFSIDGAQLFRNKKSDCWIYIWIIPNLHWTTATRFEIFFLAASFLVLKTQNIWIRFFSQVWLMSPLFRRRGYTSGMASTTHILNPSSSSF